MTRVDNLFESFDDDLACHAFRRRHLIWTCPPAPRMMQHFDPHNDKRVLIKLFTISARVNS